MPASRYYCLSYSDDHLTIEGASDDAILLTAADAGTQVALRLNLTQLEDLLEFAKRLNGVANQKLWSDLK